MDSGPALSVTRVTFLVLLGTLTLVGCGDSLAEVNDREDFTPLSSRDFSGDPAFFEALLGAQDRRAAGEGDEDLLRQGLGAPTPGIRRFAVRAIGRLERPHAAEWIYPLLGDGDPAVRGEAAQALAQSVSGEVGSASPDSTAVRSVREALHAALADEADARVLARLARALGRLPMGAPEEVEERYAALLAMEERTRSDRRAEAARIGVARGALALRRTALQQGWGSSPAGSTAESRLLARLEEFSQKGQSAFLRRAAAQARRAFGDLPPALVPSWLTDEDDEVRREGAAALAVAALRDSGLRTEGIRKALDDPSRRVRLEAIRSFARIRRDGESCAPLLAAVDDPAIGVSLGALSALAGTPQAGPCPEADRVRARLLALADSLPRGGPVEKGSHENGSDGHRSDWHRAVTALETLALLDADAARVRLSPFLIHPSPFVRARAATLTGTLGERGLLELASDREPIVRVAALQALDRLPGGVPLPLLFEQLSFSDDPELLRTTALFLEGRASIRVVGGPSREEVADALSKALGRLVARGEETSRDARIALLEQGSAWALPSSSGLAEPTPPPGAYASLPLPDLNRLRQIEEMRIEISLARGGSLLLRLHPFEAPTSAHRFVSLAEAGTFDGLTFHRVVPNFVVQGGSPGANEYAGHGAFTRDEIGSLGHWRGTVGVSTRGRDTGDGQFFVNLVDNLRLDGDYTVFGELLGGFDVLDEVEEGDVIQSIRVNPSP